MLMHDASHPELVPSYPKRLEAVIVVKSKVLNKYCEYLCTGYFFFSIYLQESQAEIFHFVITGYCV